MRARRSPKQTPSVGRRSPTCPRWRRRGARYVGALMPATPVTPATPEELLARFGLERFRPGQREAVSAALERRDSLVVMPTGGGKSLCYQLPALVGDGLVVVVSPLIALMSDQVDNLEEAGVPATFLNSSLPPAEYGRRWRDLGRRAYRILYLAPERLVTEEM